jgi:dTDP-4-amino-4,6-dideoxygalactose transaminase
MPVGEPVAEDRFLPVAEPDLGPLEEAMMLAAVKSGWVSSLGEYIGRFESERCTFLS